MPDPRAPHRRPQRLLALLLLLVGVFVGGALPGAGQLFPPPWDKLVHLAGWFALTILLLDLLPGRARMAVALALLVGVADELHQLFLPGRHAGIGDWLADAAGSLLALGWRAGYRIPGSRPTADDGFRRDG